MSLPVQDVDWESPRSNLSSQSPDWEEAESPLWTLSLTILDTAILTLTMSTDHILYHHHTITHYLLSTHTPAIAAGCGIIDPFTERDIKKRMISDIYPIIFDK